MTEMMKAGVASETGLAIQRVSRPEPTREQVLVRVLAAGMNRADLNAAKGAGVASRTAGASRLAWNGPAKSSLSAMPSLPLSPASL